MTNTYVVCAAMVKVGRNEVELSTGAQEIVWNCSEPPTVTNSCCSAISYAE